MDEKQFFDDLGVIYRHISRRNQTIGEYYKAATTEAYPEKRLFLDEFLTSLGLEVNGETRMAAATRLADLREDSLTQAIKAAGGDEELVQRGKDMGYDWVSAFYLGKHEELLAFIEKKGLLSPFYRTLLHGVHEAGKAFGNFHINWNAHIINTVNKELVELLEGDEERIFHMLREKNLMDRGHNGVEADRSYSALVKKGQGYEAKAYADVFDEDVRSVSGTLEELVTALGREEDEIFAQKESYIAYFKAIIDALTEQDSHRLVERWAEVDRCWMRVDAPLQVGHPLEYYEDHFRKAVAVEWDVRMVNPEYQKSSVVSEKIAAMFTSLHEEIGSGYEPVKERVQKNIGRVQLYIGQPMFFYGSEFCGLFSAQVVPNDEVVTKESGKKIFAFSDRVLDSVRNRPKMKLDREIFPKVFLDKEHDLVFNKEEIWHKVYEITTIGHEYGHVLWLDNDTESVMNVTGNYKNIEEFKATSGGLVSFFMDEEAQEEYWEEVMLDTVKRSVKLMAWMEVPEVLPYYCEGLIHLEGMFVAGVLAFKEGRLDVDLSKEAYERLKKWYIQTYKELGLHYLQKRDASDFLFRFASKKGKRFLPKDKDIAAFVTYYYELYKKIGRVVDEQGQ